jgi:hypothetical protein
MHQFLVIVEGTIHKLRLKVGQVLHVAAEHFTAMVSDAEFTDVDRDSGQAVIRFGGSLYEVSLRPFGLSRGFEMTYY